MTPSSKVKFFFFFFFMMELGKCLIICFNLCMFVSLEEFLFVTGAPGQQLSEAQTRTPLLGPSGPVCTLQFSYSLSGSNPHIGTTSAVIHLSPLC